MPASTGAAWLVAPDSFKGTFAAPLVAQALAEGLRDAGCASDVCPLGDGGEGTLDVLVAALGGSLVRVPARDPLGRTIEATFALLADGRTAVVETAAASGLHLVDETQRDAETASSAGTGELIAAAARAGAQRILVAVGGSATTDGGMGAIEAIRAGGGLGGATLEVLCDTRMPFERAAAVFSPQKGADADAVARLGARLEQIAAALPRDPRGLPMSGCAGGLSGGLWAAFGAWLRSGADVVLDAVSFDRRAAAAGHVVTGEGRIDSQSLDGKLISVVTRRAIAVRAPVHAVVGQLEVEAGALASLGLASVVQASALAAIRDAAHSLGARST
ncbi:MAG TPA: glycerate kinase [Solirubrobacteraceae bacterium]|jgi:glycerate kinase|nr:glycerate kinase [Solirubrobacteraceae bacterium]